MVINHLSVNPGVFRHVLMIGRTPTLNVSPDATKLSTRLGMFGARLYMTTKRIRRTSKRVLLESVRNSDELKVAVDGGGGHADRHRGTWIGWGEADRDPRRSGAVGVVNRIKVKKGGWWW